MCAWPSAGVETSSTFEKNCDRYCAIFRVEAGLNDVKRTMDNCLWTKRIFFTTMLSTKDILLKRTGVRNGTVSVLEIFYSNSKGRFFEESQYLRRRPTKVYVIGISADIIPFLFFYIDPNCLVYNCEIYIVFVFVLVCSIILMNYSLIISKKWWSRSRENFLCCASNSTFLAFNVR